MRDDYQAAFSSFTAHTFNSGMPHTGSSAAWVSLFAAASEKWNGMNTVQSTAFGDIAIFATMLPRQEATEIFSPSLNPYITASAGEISTKLSGERSYSCRRFCGSSCRYDYYNDTGHALWSGTWDIPHRVFPREE